MNITEKIIITDTNIITDLSNAKILQEFVMLKNVYISDMVKNDEINSKTGDVSIISKFKVIHSTNAELLEVNELSKVETALSPQDLINYVLARDNNLVLATGDNRLRKYCIKMGLEVIRTLKIIKLMVESRIISNEKAIEACNLLMQNTSTRISSEDISNFIEELNEDLVSV